MNAINKFLTLQDIENLDKNSDIIYLKALYQCESIVCLDENQAPLYANNTNEFYTYQSSFYLSFCDREKISDEYLEARKALYKTYQAIKKQKSQDILLLLDKEQKNQNKSKLDKDEYILKTGDQQSSIIFLDTQDSLSNLIHIHSNKCDIFTKSGTLFDIEVLQEQYGLNFSSYQTQIFLYSTLLVGDSETSTPLYFGKVDSEGRFEPLSPTYVLNDLGEGKAHLKVFLDNQSLILYNYSLSENSLGVKLECKSKESKEMREKDKERIEKEKAQKEALMITPSLSAFTPIIEDDTLMCSHGGSVKLQSQKGKKFKSKGVPLILESDLANSSITGCPNPPLSGGPCTKIALIPPLALSVKKFNGEGAPLQEYASMIMTDKGVPLMCIPKPNQFKVFQPANPQGSGESAKEIVANIKLEKPKLRLHLKDNIFQRDNIPLYRIFNDGEEIKQEEAIESIELKLKDVSHPIGDTLKKEYDKNYEIKEAQVQIAFSILRLVFVISTKIPKVFKKALEEYEDKDYGVGNFKLLDSFSSNLYNQDKEAIEHLRVFIAPAKLTKIDLEFALGLDEKIPHKSNECGFVVIMGGRDEGSKESDKSSRNISQEENQSNQKTEDTRKVSKEENQDKNKVMKLSQDGKEMLKKWEGFKNFPYDDKKPYAELLSWTEGATIGVGHLILQSEWEAYKDGLNDNEIDALLSKDLERFERAVNKRIKVSLKQHQFDALVILAFNIGVGEGDGVDSFMNSSVVKLINKESGSNYNTLEDAWLAWKKSKGKDSSGLLNRRKSEHKLYTQGIYTKE